MGRWSVLIAGRFLDWLGRGEGGHWLDVGCGTGALTLSILDRARPDSLTAIDPSEAFIAFARRRFRGRPVELMVAGAEALPDREGGYDAIVSGLVLNFIPDPAEAVHLMKARLSPGGVLAAYVWDYAAGMQFLRKFWDEATAIDPSAAELDEATRFPICEPDALARLFEGAGLSRVETAAVETDTVFQSFEEYWRPFLSGVGPAPSYVAALDAGKREQLQARLERSLGFEGTEPLRLVARAWAVRGIAAAGA